MDLFSVTSDPPFFRSVLAGLKRIVEHEIGLPGEAFTTVVGLESRGFVLGPFLALDWNLPFAPIRKKGKLPGIVT
jgi:adenine phosphoribosyltransferase